MATMVIMPRQGQSVESCIITKWHKQKGDPVAAGDKLFTYETDKATFKEEARAEGILLEIFYKEGDDVPCLENVCVIGNEGEAFTSEPSAKTEAVTEKVPSPEVMEKTAPFGTFESASPNSLKISPRAEALAEKSGADLSFAVPSGPEGRIIERDVQALISAGRLVTSAAKAEYTRGAGVSGTGLGGRVTTFDLASAADDYEEVPLTNIRKIIAKSMQASLSNSAQLTLSSSFDASGIMEYRKKLKAQNPEANITITDIIVYAASRVLLNHRSINAHFFDDKIIKFNRVHMGLAVDTERGLMVPTLFNADLLSLGEISAALKDISGRCRGGDIDPDLLTGATFTISNLGTLGVESFTPVINPPQAGILGVCSITERFKGNRFYPAMGLSLTFDHRALDGADAARFLKDLVGALENFDMFLNDKSQINS